MARNNFDKFGPSDTDLTIKFESPKAAEHFKSWLCGQGEQSYWRWMECREGEEDGPITALRFDYWTEGPVITAECGRLDAPDEDEDE